METLRQEVEASPRVVSRAEAEAVLRLAAERESVNVAAITTADLAETLRVSEVDVERLLAEVRGQKPVAVAPKPHRDRTWLTSLAICLLLIGTASLAFFGIRTFRNANPPVPALEPVAALAPVASADLAAPGPMVTYPPGVTVIVAGEGFHLGSESSQSDIFRLIRLHGEDSATRTLATVDTANDDASILKKVQAGNFDDQFISHPQVEVAFAEPNGKVLMLSKGSIPVYSGGDSRIAELLRAERERRYRDMASRAFDLLPQPK